MMKQICTFLLLVLAFYAFANDLATKSLKDYETELKREFPFVEHRKGDKVTFVIDNGETKVSGTVIRINAKGVMVEENGIGIFYSFQRLGVEGGRFFLPEKYNEWIGQLAIVKKVEADKFRLLRITEQQKAEQKKKLEEQRKADAAKGIYMIPNYINDAFGINFGRAYSAEIKSVDYPSPSSSRRGIITKSASNSDEHSYFFEPQDPIYVTSDNEKQIHGWYIVDVIGKNRIAYKVEVVRLEPKYVDEIVAFFKKKYGNFNFPKPAPRTVGSRVRLISEKNPNRWIEIMVYEPSTNRGMSITYYCKDIEEKYKEKDQVSIGR